MSEEREIPDDVMATAERAAADGWAVNVTLVIARAIMAEREMCATIAERKAESLVAFEERNGFSPQTATVALHRYQCEQIATAIRSGQ